MYGPHLRAVRSAADALLPLNQWAFNIDAHLLRTAKQKP